MKAPKWLIFEPFSPWSPWMRIRLPCGAWSASRSGRSRCGVPSCLRDPRISCWDRQRICDACAWSPGNHIECVKIPSSNNAIISFNLLVPSVLYTFRTYGQQILSNLSNCFTWFCNSNMAVFLVEVSIASIFRKWTIFIVPSWRNRYRGIPSFRFCGPCRHASHSCDGRACRSCGGRLCSASCLCQRIPAKNPMIG